MRAGSGGWTSIGLSKKSWFPRREKRSTLGRNRDQRNRASWLPLQHIHQWRSVSDTANTFLLAVKFYPPCPKFSRLCLAHTARGENWPKQGFRSNTLRHKIFGLARARLKLLYCLACIAISFHQFHRSNPQLATGGFGEKKIVASPIRLAKRRPRLVEIDDKAPFPFRRLRKRYRATVPPASADGTASSKLRPNRSDGRGHRGFSIRLAISAHSL